MALPAIGSSNVGIRAIGSAIGEGCGVQQTTNLSLKHLCIGGGGLTFSSIGGPVMDMSNVSLAVENAPYAMSECFGGVHSTSGGGGGGGGGGSDPPFP